MNHSFNAGPASYYPKLESQTHGCTIRGRPVKKSTGTIVPGPGKYDLSASVNYLYPSVKKIISAPSNLARPHEHVVPPGPGSYNNYIPEKAHGPKYFNPVGFRREVKTEEKKTRIKYKPEKSQEKVNRTTY